MLRDFTSPIVLALALASCMSPQESFKDEDCGLADEKAVEHAIILASLRYFHPSDADLIVISRTRSDLTDGSGSDITREFAFAGIEVSQAAIDSMAAKSAKPIDLDASLLVLPDASIILLPPEAVPTTQWTDAQAWVDFREAYGVHGAVSVSRPGFSCDDAVIARVNECGGFCSQASWYVLHRQDDGSWIVTDELGVWVS